MKIDASKYYRTPLSPKQRNIAAFTRLLHLSRQMKYRDRPLEDRSILGLQYAIALWMEWHGYKCRRFANSVAIEFEDGEYIVRVAGTHVTHPDYRDADEGDEFELTVYNLVGFMDWYDRYLG